ncbi:unnamed protein product [Spirodela intermedia]|uniref:Uncharacterized protein n=1 Tax=Spirodela intermedia TaxID=51605 RepID=A0A7I8JY41_SPIIN|nr:unnamed protein product [Spirodela intermedia]
MKNVSEIDRNTLAASLDGIQSGVGFTSIHSIIPIEKNKSCQIVSGGCHPVERKNDDFAALRRLSPDREELDGGGAPVRSFILWSTQQEEALHCIWYALRRWRLISQRIVHFLTTACSSINWR